MPNPVRNLTTGLQIKHSQALRWIEQGVYEWVRPGSSIRKLSLQEMVVKRSELAKKEAGMGYLVEGKDRNGNPTMIVKPYYAEIPGLRYEPTQPNQASTRQSYQLAAQANRFCIEHA